MIKFIQDIAISIRAINRRFIIVLYVSFLTIISMIFNDMSVTGMVFGISCGIAALNQWKRVFPIFRCYVFVFWIARVTLYMSGYKDLLFEIGDVGLLSVSLVFSAFSFVFLVFANDRISSIDNVADVKTIHGFYAVMFCIIAYLWPLYIGPFRRLSTPIALFVAGIISDMALFSFLSLLFRSLSYLSSKEDTDVR